MKSATKNEKTQRSCMNCRYEHYDYTDEQSTSYCGKHKQEINNMFPSLELSLDKIGCLQFSKKPIKKIKR